MQFPYAFQERLPRQTTIVANIIRRTVSSCTPSRAFLVSPAVVSQTVGHEEVNLGSTLLDKVVGECPETVISVNDCNVRCLLDTGAQVSTLTESFYKQFLSRDVDLIDEQSLE